MLPQQTPPVTETGVIKWLRENLFSSWLNAILTVLSLWAVWWVAAHVLPWAVYGIWNASSLNECRAIRDELYGARHLGRLLGRDHANVGTSFSSASTRRSTTGGPSWRSWSSSSPSRPCCSTACRSGSST